MENQYEIHIDPERCVGCGSCVSDCVMHVLSLDRAKAKVTGTTCIGCGHCFAICPKNAVTIHGLADDNVIPVAKEDVLDPNLLLRVMKTRRSIRQFKDAPVTREKLLQIIEAGRYSATAVNRQDVSYLILTKKLRRAEKYAVDFFRKMQREEGSSLNRWSFDDHFFFKGAPAAIVVLSDHTVDGALAAAHMETMANALGLGVLYSGFFTTAVNQLPELRRLLGLNDAEMAVTTLVLGYATIKYERSAPRKPAGIKEA